MKFILLVALLDVWLGPTDNVQIIEYNTFGFDPPRHSVIFRDPDGSIVDWRWYPSVKELPTKLSNGRYVLVWNDCGKPRTVYCNSVRFTRTHDDRELTERATLPEHKRRKLSR